MKNRPTSVTIIAWILIVMSILSAIASVMTMNNPAAKEMMMRTPMPILLQQILMYVGLSVMFIAGVGFLKRKNWARYLYLIWGVIGIVIGLVTSPVKLMLIPGMVFFVLVVFFLFRPKANDYFLKKE